MRVQEYPPHGPVVSFEEWLDLKYGDPGHNTCLNYEFDGPPDRDDTRATYAEYTVWTWEDPVALLVGKYPLNQIGAAMWHEPMVCDDGRLPQELRDRAWVAIHNLFRGLFGKYCSPVLSHLDESNPQSDELDGACYMWWHLKSTPYDDPRFFYLLEDCLESGHPALQESALHGLGHAEYDLSARPHVRRIIDRFLQSNWAARPELVPYAKCARRGQVL